MLSYIYKYVRKNIDDYKKIKHAVSYLFYIWIWFKVFIGFLGYSGVKPNHNAALVR